MKRTTYTAYFMFLFIGYIFTIAGVVPQDIAVTFGVKDSDVVFAFTFFIVGTTSAILLNGVLLEKITPKQEAILSFGLMVTGMTGMITAPSIYLFTLFLLINGLGIGMLVSLGNYLIINMYEEERAKKLNILNFYYSLGAVAGPFIAGYILKYGKKYIINGKEWIYVYFPAIAGAAVIFLFLIYSDYSSIKKVEKKADNVKRESWNWRVYIIGCAIFLYVMSEMTITYWIVIYLKETALFSILMASQLLSTIWFFMMIGRFLSGKAVDYIRPYNYVILLGVTASAGVLAMVLFKEKNILWIAAAVIGTGYSGMYATILTYGTHQVKEHSTKLMTFYITCGSAGGILATPLSSYIKKSCGITAAISVSFISVSIVVILVILTGLLKKSKTN